MKKLRLASRLHESIDRHFPTPLGIILNQVQPFTMCEYARLRSLYVATKRIIERNVPGDFVECGSAAGGSAALIGLTQKQSLGDRRLWLFDTFEGLPSPSRNDPDYEIARRLTGKFNVGLPKVEKLFDDLELRSNVRFVKGLFQDTVPHAPIERIALLHLDGDWHDSIRVCLDHLYDKMSAGGWIQFDDYGFWKGARKAVDEFMAERKIKLRLKYIDAAGRALQIPA